MATYYWVKTSGGSPTSTGTWDNASTANWSTSSGGAPGSGPPTSADTVIFDAASDNNTGFTVTIGASAACAILTISGVDQTMTWAGSAGLTITTTATFQATNFTNGYTGTITMSGASPTFSGAGNTFQTLSFTSTALVTCTINGDNTFNGDLTFANRAAAGIGSVVLGGNQTIAGTLTLSTVNVGNRRIFVRSSVTGTARTITLNGTLTAPTDVDFRNITTAGTVARPWTGTRLGDCTGNTGITFTAARTIAGANPVYWNLVGGGGLNSTAWANSSGGAVSLDNFPLAQDDLVIENTGLNSGATLTFNAGYNLGGISYSTRTLPVTQSTTVAFSLYRGYTLSSSVTTSGTLGITFSSQSASQTVTSAGVALTNFITIDCFGQAFILSGNLTVRQDTTSTLSSGTLDLGNNTLSCGAFSLTATSPLTRAIAFGSTGKISCVLNNATVWNGANATNFSYTGTSNVESTYSGATGTRSFYHGTTAGATEANSPSITVTAGTDTVAIFAGSSVKNFDLSAFAGTFTNTARTIYGNLTFGASNTLTAGASATTFAATSGTQTITTAGKTLDFPLTFAGAGGTFTLGDNMTVGATRTVSLTAGTLNVNGKTLSAGIFSTTGSTTRSISFNTSTSTISISGTTTSAWTASGSGFTTTNTNNTGVIKMTAATAKTFTGGGFTYPTLDQAGAGALTIAGSNTFYDITSSYTATGATTVTFTAGTTQTVTQFTASGTSSNQLTLNSTSAGNAWYLSDSSGTNSISYTTLSDSHAQGGATWDAYTTNGNINGGSNNNWNFAIPVTYSYSADIKLRSMAQRGRF